MNGALLVDKPAGVSSARVVGLLKKKFNIRKIGHAGTLDPMATGLLVLLCGKATRLQSLYLNASKQYEGIIQLGFSTDTDDLVGNILSRDSEKHFKRRPKEAVIAELHQQFSGLQSQVPPQFSAVHVAGKRSYQLAAKGEAVVLPAREVDIRFEELEFYDDERLFYRITCSKGTYVRSLARDMGHFVGSYGCIESIRRTASYPFTISRAYSLEFLKAATNLPPLYTMEELTSELPSVTLQDGELSSLAHGKQGVLRQIEVPGGSATDIAAIVDNDGKLFGLIEPDVSASSWKLRCVLADTSVLASY